jgi:hypothetical protein
MDSDVYPDVWITRARGLCGRKIARVFYRGFVNWNEYPAILHSLDYAVDLEFDSGETATIAAPDNYLDVRPGPYVDRPGTKIFTRSGKDCDEFYEDVSSNSYWQSRIGKKIDRVVLYRDFSPSIIELGFEAAGAIWIAAAHLRPGESVSFYLDANELSIVADPAIALKLIVPFRGVIFGEEICAGR